jgi:hypothetical protein
MLCHIIHALICMSVVDNISHRTQASRIPFSDESIDFIDEGRLLPTVADSSESSGDESVGRRGGRDRTKGDMSEDRHVSRPMTSVTGSKRL